MLKQLLQSPFSSTKRKKRKIDLPLEYPHIDFKKKKLIDNELRAKYAYYDDPLEYRHLYYLQCQNMCDKYFAYRTKTIYKATVGECTYYRQLEAIEKKNNKILNKAIKKHLKR